jgi:MFS family permease
MRKTRKNNLQIFIIANSLMALAFGLFGPFYLIFINNLGGDIENFGIATGLIVLFGALCSLFVGKYSDRAGKKTFLIISGYFSAIIVFMYTTINQLWELYILQAVSGIIIAAFETSEQAYLADITEKHKRGYQIGKYTSFIGIAEAISIFAGGFFI